jgi:hypothetical protein
VLFNHVLDILKNHNITSYQIIGPHIWVDYIYKNPLYLENSECLDNILVYAYDCVNYYLLYNSKEDLFNENSFACHWYNGGNHTKNFINKFNDSYNGIFNKDRSIIEKYIVNIK